MVSNAEQLAWQAFSALQYQRHNGRRQEHLATLGLPLSDRTVLELGAGIGDHTTFFLDRGCKVHSIEARAENLSLFARRYQALIGSYLAVENLMCTQADLNGANASKVEGIEAAEVVYNYGLLYHLSEPAAHIAWSAKLCTSLYLLETCVSGGDHEAENLIDEDVGLATQAFQSKGCRPTRPWIFARLKEHFEFVYMPKTQPCHEEFPLDWSTVPHASHQYLNLTRAVFVASREKLSIPLLVPEIPRLQTRS